MKRRPWLMPGENSPSHRQFSGEVPPSAQVNVSALPASAGTVYSPGLQIKGGAVNEANVALFEVEIDAPALTTTMLPSGERRS